MRVEQISSAIVLLGYKKGVVRVIDSPRGDGPVCAIGDFWFYFSAPEVTAEECVKRVPEDTLIEAITDAVNELDGSTNEWEYCYHTLCAVAYHDSLPKSSLPGGWDTTRRAMYNADLAKSICEELGFEWDENATVPTLKGEPVTAETIQRAFAFNASAGDGARLEHVDTLDCDSGIVIVTENADGKLYTIKAESLRDIIDDWFGECNFCPANDAPVYFVSLDGVVVNALECSTFEGCLHYLEAKCCAETNCVSASDSSKVQPNDCNGEQTTYAYIIRSEDEDKNSVYLSHEASMGVPVWTRSLWDATTYSFNEAVDALNAEFFDIRKRPDHDMNAPIRVAGIVLNDRYSRVWR